MTPFKILIIADDRLIRRILSQAIKNWGFTPVEASTAGESLELFDLYRPVATLLDSLFSDGSGLEVLCEIKNRQPNAAVIMIADHLRTDETLTAFRAGASDVIAKPINLEELQTAISNSIKARERSGEISQVPQETINSFKFEQIIGQSPALRETISLARKVAASDVLCFTAR
jgi:DNA-binding NtrC family response regulator